MLNIGKVHACTGCEQLLVNDCLSRKHVSSKMVVNDVMCIDSQQDTSRGTMAVFALASAKGVTMSSLCFTACGVDTASVAYFVFSAKECVGNMGPKLRRWLGESINKCGL